MDNIIRLTELAEHFGPFAFAVIFVIFVLKFVANRLDTADGENAQLYRKLTVVAWSSTLLLIGVSVVAWFVRDGEDPMARTVTGVVEDLKAPEYVYSPTMYVRKARENEVTGTYDYEWIAHAKDVRAGDELELTVSYSPSEFYVEPLIVTDALFGRHMRYKWERRNARLVAVVEEATQTAQGHTISGDSFVSLFVASAHAAASQAFQSADTSPPSPCTTEPLLGELCLSFLDRELADTDTSSFVAYHAKRSLLDMLNKLDDQKLTDVMVAIDKRRSSPSKFVPVNRGAAQRDVFALATDTRDDVQSSAIVLAARLNVDAFRDYLTRQLAHKERARRLAAIQTTTAWGDIASMVDTLRNYQATETDASIARAIEAAIALVDAQVYAARLAQIPDAQVRAMIERGLELRNQGVRYVRGGRDLTTGLDSVGFAAVLLSDAGAMDLSNRGELLPTELYDQLRDVDPETLQAGDLLFFDYGIVMVYLWGDQMMGMTQQGVVLASLSDAAKTWGVGRFAADTTRVSAFDSEDLGEEVPELTLEEADVLVKNYYASESEWAGVFTIASILDWGLEKKPDAKLLARVRYVYTPTPDSYRSDTGTDYRIFDFEYKDSAWSVTGMRGNLSAEKATTLSRQEAERLVTEYYRFQGAWAGIYEMDQVESLEVKTLDETNLLAEVKYRYRVQNYDQKVLEDGEDTRNFYIVWEGGEWQVAYMDVEGDW